MNEQAKEERRQYQREWRQKNKERVKEINRRYWEKRAKERQHSKSQNDLEREEAGQ